MEKFKIHLIPIPFKIYTTISYNIKNETKSHIMVIRYGYMYNEYKYVKQIVRNNLKKILLSYDKKRLNLMKN